MRLPKRTSRGSSFFLVRTSAWLLLGLCCWGGNLPLGHGHWKDDVDYTRLATMLGSALPLGGGVPIAMVEAPNVASQYFPDINSVEFSAMTDPLMTVVTFTDGSGGQANGFSNHATNLVAGQFFGNTGSVVLGANAVTVYEAGSYLNNVLHTPSGPLPETQNFRVQNFSWVGSYDNTPLDPPTATELGNDVKALRRLDSLIDRDNITAVVGLNNGITAMPRLLAQGYNSIAVGRFDGLHSTGLTDIADYGPGRSKPEIVINQLTTSSATASVSSMATFLHSVVTGTDAAQNEVVKATLLAGATKNEFTSWSRTTTQPLDNTFGAGEGNIYNSYLITQGGQFAGSNSPSTPVGSHGWDYQTISTGAANELKYNFHIPAGSTAQEFSIILAWNVAVQTPFNTQTLSNLDIKFTNSLDQIIDQSISTVDNVEHIYLTNLAAGDYTLTVSNNSITSRDFGLAWRTATLFDNFSADFDEDGDVDGRDFLTWQRGYGKLLGAAHGEGDADGDGDVDTDDVLLFQAQYLPVLNTPAVLAVAVPEPGTLALLTGGMCFYVLGRSRSRTCRRT